MNRYYEQLTKHILEKLDVGEWDVYRMYDPKYGKGLMAVTIIFSPNGIIINGDYAVGTRGINSVAGYDVEWFGSKKSRDYLAEKFIGTETYNDDKARKDWGWFQEEYGLDDRDVIQGVFDDPDYYDLEWEFEYPVVRFFEKHMGNYCDYPFGHEYDKNKLDHLVAIQQRFSELYQEII